MLRTNVVTETHVVVTETHVVVTETHVGAAPGSHVPEKTDPFFSDQLTLVLQWIIYTVLCQAINCFGIVSNIINVICFVKQGFKDTVNISLVALTVSDIGCLLTITWSNVCLNPSFNSLNLPFEGPEIQYLTGAVPHFTFSRTTAWITALITLERCLCISLPLKVRNIITRGRVCVVLLCVYAVLILGMSPMYMVNSLAYKFFPSKNRTLLGLVYTEDRKSVESISFVINHVSVPSVAFIIIIICTIALVVNLQKNTEWRKVSAPSPHVDNLSIRNQRVVKMVVMISTLFIACLFPVTLYFMAVSLEPRLNIEGQYRNTFVVLGGVCLVLESINSSANIFIYYKISSRYRVVFRESVCQ